MAVAVTHSTIEVSMEPKHPAANCSECPLREKGKYVPSTFPSKNQHNNYGKKIALIGESPGRTEVAKGAPFLGPSGEVMNAVLKEHGLDRREMIVSNAIACYYSDTDFDKPPPEAVVACRPRLLDEMKACNIDTAITVGAVAATSLLDTKVGITKLRAGAPRFSEYCLEAGGGVYVIPTFHPAFALRDQSKFPYIVRDVAKVKPGGVWDKWKDPDYLVVEATSLATKWINWMIDSDYRGPIEVDTESSAEKDETFGGAINEVLCIGVWYEDANKVIVFTPDSLNKFNRRLLGELFVRRGIVAQNGKYDVGRCLNSYLSVDDDTVLDIPVAFDTMLASYCLDEGKGVHGLKYMQSEYLGAPDYEAEMMASMERGKAREKAERKKAGLPIRGLFTGKNFAWIEPEALYRYNAFDVYGTRLLKDKFVKELKDGLVDGLFEWLMGVNHMLVHVEQNGMCVDLDYNAQLEIEFKDMLADVEFVGTEQGFNPNSPQQVKKYLNRVGVTTDSTDKTVLRGLIERYGILGREDVVEFCQSLLDHRGASKQMGTYITGLRRSLIEGVAHPSFLLHGTTTGRTSSRNPNLQNIPRGSTIKRQFVPSSPNRVLIQADYSNAEFRVMTWLGKDESTREIFNDPSRKIFIELSRRMYGREVFDNLEPFTKKEKYTLIKTFAYGIAYGREAKAIALAFSIPLRYAQSQMQQFQAMIPGIITYQKSVKKKVFAGEDLVNPFGRRRRFHLITNANVVTVMNEALSFMPQSTASDICLDAAVELDRRGHQIRNLVHDAILTECDRKDVAETAQAMREVMVGTAERVTEGYVRFDVDIEVGPTWGDLVPLENYLEHVV